MKRVCEELNRKKVSKVKLEFFLQIQVGKLNVVELIDSNFAFKENKFLIFADYCEAKVLSKMHICVDALFLNLISHFEGNFPSRICFSKFFMLNIHCQ